ncbi:nucleoside recognition membrane protein YjiH [Saccharopolyspora lacisalsi]|uniref:Nucleoside recognition membrane protein YjiH n=1 Tax=Halosaccharopolyspora lacisalsi TaxID=1000566 RepID=A0A839DZL9_9PSEU|nr:YjiH family protein [Halosaccharopolyspora lacisalsi]MBA8826463.1 nucleoside recognition membrane protein YjiH [Halosaccharopolyspora lacisalsi]
MAVRRHHEEKTRAPSTRDSASMWKFFVYSSLGAFVFFVPIEIAGRSSILLDHVVTAAQDAVPNVLPYYTLAVVLAGAAYPLITGTWRRSTADAVFSGFKLVGLLVGVMLVFGIGPAWLFEPDMGPFLFTALAVPVSLLVPLGAVFLALLVGYGLLEYIGVLVEPVMRPVWRTPGRSAIDAVASFVGSYSLGLLITDRVYREGKYSGREAAVIATGFSTVSATFMVVVAATLGLMPIWNTYFWTSLAITFLVTTVTVRIPPLSRIGDSYVGGVHPQPEDGAGAGRFSRAWSDARETVAAAPSLAANVGRNLKDGLIMTMSILPSILSIGLVGLVLATYTPVFDWLGYLFYPVTWALQVPEPLLLAKSSAVGIAEMFLPSLLAAGATPVVAFIVAVVSVSQIVFFSALVPCVVATGIPVSVPQMILIWFERVVLSLVLATPVAMLLF